MRLPLTRSGRIPAAALVLALVPLALAPAPAHAGDNAKTELCEEITADGGRSKRVTDANTALQTLDDAALQRYYQRPGFLPGGGVKIAVIDSGIAPDVAEPKLVDVVQATNLVSQGPPQTYHGTAVAGLAAGRDVRGRPDQRVGLAPWADVYDVRVFDGGDEEGSEPLTTRGLELGLGWVLDQGDEIDVVVIAGAVPPSGVLAEKVAQVARTAVIVAASGNRVIEEGGYLEEYAARKPGQDVSDKVFPAGYDKHVLAVSASYDGWADDGVNGQTADLGDYVLPNSSIDVAAPVYGALSYGLNGQLCRMGSVATSWATGMTGGLAALLVQRYPNDNPAQIRARIVETAAGSPEVPGSGVPSSNLTGAGVIQPLEALQRRLVISRKGVVQNSTAVTRTPGKLMVPPPDPDPLDRARENIVWWGLIAGGALAIGALLRPWLARRRTG